MIKEITNVQLSSLWPWPVLRNGLGFDEPHSNISVTPIFCKGKFYDLFVGVGCEIWGFFSNASALKNLETIICKSAAKKSN